MAANVVLHYREGPDTNQAYAVDNDLDVLAQQWKDHLRTGSPAFLELTRADARGTYRFIVRLSSVHTIDFNPQGTATRTPRAKRAPARKR